MPLVNKCKTYKEENVSHKKILAWMCLIENTNDQIVNHYLKVGYNLKRLYVFIYCIKLDQLNIFSRRYYKNIVIN